MITTSDISVILYKACEPFGLVRYPEGNVPRGEVGSERVVIHVKQGQPGTIWTSHWCEVNALVPDIAEGTADLNRLAELEGMMWAKLRGCGSHDGITYRYKPNSTVIMEDSQLRCHMVNARVLFETLNVIEKY
ncbi:MAG: hypothetical protein LIP02_03915 [Bacteroidales bacterium]|nr:hypothetical protein [Bacteroidales bacterium]